MAFQKRGNSNVELSGFWTRTIGETITGKFLKFVPNIKNPKNENSARPFVIVELEKPAKGETCTINIEDVKDPVQVKGGEFVGIAANWSIKSQLDMVTDIGKRIRIHSDKTMPSPQDDKKVMHLMTVEVDE
jgi:hypothetical protein